MTRVGWCPGGRTVADMLARYPGTRVVRIFVRPGKPMPPWDGAILGPLVGQDIVVHLSFKTWDPAAVLRLVEGKPSGLLLILTFGHEPEQGTAEGDLPLDQWRARWAELVALLADHPRRDEMLLVPVYTRFWWQKYAGDLRWLVAYPGIDAIGWDIYSSDLTRYRTPDDLLRVPRDIAARTGLPYLIAELGAVVVGEDAAGQQAWMRAMVDAARADGVLTTCWYHKDAWDLADPANAAGAQTWRELIQEAPMPTYTQLQAEPYWGREVVTPAMDWLGDELCRRTGRPREAAGTKGDRYHLRGAHRSQEWIKRSVYCTNRTYTVQPDLGAEMQRWIAGFDFTPGSAADMIAQSKRILAAMKRGELDEVREFYGNVDGDQVVDGWDNVADRAASSDSSHLWHWHLSVDRRHCNNQQLMERILAIALGDPVEDDDMTPAQFVEILKDPTVAAMMRAMPWTYTGGGIPAGMSALSVLNETVLKVRALVDAVGKVDDQAAAQLADDFARIEAAVASTGTADEQRDQAAATKLEELTALVQAEQTGQLDATEVLRRMGEVLTAGTAAPQAG